VSSEDDAKVSGGLAFLEGGGRGKKNGPPSYIFSRIAKNKKGQGKKATRARLSRPSVLEKKRGKGSYLLRLVGKGEKKGEKKKRSISA